MNVFTYVYLFPFFLSLSLSFSPKTWNRLNNLLLLLHELIVSHIFSFRYIYSELKYKEVILFAGGNVIISV